MAHSYLVQFYSVGKRIDIHRNQCYSQNVKQKETDRSVGMTLVS